MREPDFWWRAPGIAARFLSPLAACYGAIAAWRLDRQGRRAPVPVVCIGDPTVGGAGKTPTAIAVARMLMAAGERPVFLSRGYGGRARGPLRVDPATHTAAEVGDEPLLLARAATTVVSRDRVAGAEIAVASGAGVVVMDDGFQNPAIEKDAAVLVVDGARGIGNGLVTPAGPLRAPLAAQLKRADALIVIGDGPGAAALPDNARAETIPLFRARLEPEAVALATLRQGRVLAFAGIGSPDKFFATLAAHGVEVARRHGFPDHHAYTRAEAQALCAEAAHEGLILATTEKDMVRMLRDPATGELAARAKPLPVTLRFDDEAGLLGLLRARIARRRGA